MTNRDVTIAARVPLALRTDLEAVLEELRRQGRHKVDGGELDLSAVIRIAAGELRDRVLGGRGELLTYSSVETSARLLPDPEGDAARRLRLGSLDGKPATHRRGTETERMASHAAWPRATSQRRRALELLEAAGNDGLTGDELDVALERQGGGTYDGRRRLSELKAGGWVEAARDVNRAPIRRRTRRGQWADVYVIAPAAVIRLAEDRRRG